LKFIFRKKSQGLLKKEWFVGGQEKRRYIITAGLLAEGHSCRLCSEKEEKKREESLETYSRKGEGGNEGKRGGGENTHVLKGGKKILRKKKEKRQI